MTRSSVSPYSDSELAILEKVAAQHNVPADALLELINLEMGFHAMGRRKGLFPALRSLISRLAADQAEEDAVHVSD